MEGPAVLSVTISGRAMSRVFLEIGDLDLLAAEIGYQDLHNTFLFTALTTDNASSLLH